MLALTCWTVAWVGEQSWFHFGLGPREALLAPGREAFLEEPTVPACHEPITEAGLRAGEGTTSDAPSPGFHQIRLATRQSHAVQAREGYYAN